MRAFNHERANQVGDLQSSLQIPSVSMLQSRNSECGAARMIIFPLDFPANRGGSGASGHDKCKKLTADEAMHSAFCFDLSIPLR